MISRNYSEKNSFLTFFPFFTNAPGLLRVAGVTTDLAESNGSLPPGL